MSRILLPLLFNGLFFSVSPSAVHNTTPVKTAVTTRTYNMQPHVTPTAALHCSPGKTVKLQVSFKMNDKKEVQVISVSGAAPSMNAAILQNLGTFKPDMASYLIVNKTYSFTVEICNQQLS